jgi:hypothetical protein
MPKVEIPADSIKWPSKCCRCGSSSYSFRQHTDKVVIRTILSVTQYRKISLNVPICDRCAMAQYYWFGAAVLLAGIGYLLLKTTGSPNNVPVYVQLSFVGAIALAIVGVYMRPIKILGFNEKEGTLKLKVHNNQVANELVSQSKSGV